MDDSRSQTMVLDPVAYVRSPFTEKFGIPRQPGLVDSAVGEVRFVPPFGDSEALDGLDDFSHVWLIFRFHACVDQGWRPRVRPPRLGGNREVGVWASRSPFRPNFLGLSAVRLLEVVRQPQPLLRVAGIDLLDGTPVLDIKPYLPYADAIADAAGGFAREAPRPGLAVSFSARATAQLADVPHAGHLRRLINDVLALDPRPAYRTGAEPQRTYGVQLAGCNVRWTVVEDGVLVQEIRAIDDHV